MRVILKNFVEFKLKRGDAMIVGDTAIGLLTKETKKYWYYFYKETLCKVKKEKVWSYIDRGKIKIVYGSTLKHRRKKKKGRTLDLHGCKFENVEESVKKFLNFVELPCKIITGNSSKMKAYVKNIVFDYGWSCWEESATNPGTMIIVENKQKRRKN